MASHLRLYFARHGQTEGAREGRFCGDIDVPLEPSGHAMAQALARHYATTEWRAIYASPRQRARDTAQPLADRVGLPLQIDDDLREISYGAWEGLREAEVAATQPAAFQAWQADPGHRAPPGGETGFAIAERALRAVDAVRARFPEGGNVCVVSHKATIRVLVCALFGIPVTEFRRKIAAPPGTVTIVDFRDGGPMLLALADARHLPPELQPPLDG
ncbi:MAG TPA: histidine phosphatase family protein [Myxococcales bacterium]|nr:histidine phosphatase family protein [Myxococcales bacterium]